MTPLLHPPHPDRNCIIVPSPHSRTVLPFRSSIAPTAPYSHVLIFPTSHLPTRHPCVLLILQLDHGHHSNACFVYTYCTVSYLIISSQGCIAISPSQAIWCSVFRDHAPLIVERVCVYPMRVPRLLIVSRTSLGLDRGETRRPAAEQRTYRSLSSYRAAS